MKFVAAAALLPVLAAAASATDVLPTEAGKPLTIGAIVPVSWPDRASAQEMYNGMLLALKTWPGASAPTLLVKDSACDPQQAQVAAQALLAAKVDVVIGGFCVLGEVPRVLEAAGMRFISANAERIANVASTTLQLGSVPSNLAASVASRLRAETGLRVTADSSCWINYQPRVPPGYDAALCPMLHVDRTRWDDVAPTYSAAFRKPFGFSAARGYAAMQAALAAAKQLRAGGKPPTAPRNATEIETVLGKMGFGASGTVPNDAMLLSFAAQRPRLSPRDRAAFEEMLRAKACDCVERSECAQNSWTAVPFVTQCDGRRVNGAATITR